MYGPFLVYLIGVVVTVGAMLGLSYVLGQRHQDRATDKPYESGIVNTGSARVRFHARFYVVAMIFVVFDLESVYLFAWSISARDLGWPAYYAVVFFSAVLVVALAYVWRLGGLNFGPRLQRTPTMNNNH